jgi:hypothetical protein
MFEYELNKQAKERKQEVLGDWQNTIGDEIIRRAKIVSLETGKGILESISSILTIAKSKGEQEGIAWLENTDLEFPFD